MNIKKTYSNYKNICRNYLMIIVVVGCIIFAVYFGFNRISRYKFDKTIIEELIVESENTADRFEKSADRYLNSLNSAACAISEMAHSTAEANRLLKKEENYIDCERLGSVDAEGNLCLTDGRRADIRDEVWFENLLGGYDIKGEELLFDGERYIVFCVPVYKYGRVAGGICCVVKGSKLWSGAEFSEEFRYEIYNRDGVAVFGNVETAVNTGKIEDRFSADNLARYKNDFKNNVSELIVQTKENIETKIYIMPFSGSGYMLVGQVNEGAYYKKMGALRHGVTIICLIIFGISAFFIVSAIIFFKKTNQSILSHLQRVDVACRALKICYITHAADGGGEIYYKSGSVESITGFSGSEIEMLFNNEMANLIFAEDRAAAVRAFKEASLYGEGTKEINFRLIMKDREPLRFRDVIMTNGKGGAVTSVLIPMDKLFKAYEDLQNMRYRLDLVTQASSFFVMELNIKKQELFMSDNFKERLGYGLEARECFKESVIRRLIHPESYGDLETMINMYKRGNRVIRGRLRVKTSTGEYINLHIDAEVIGALVKNDVKIVAIIKESKKRSFKNGKNK